jgi:aspartate kinase
MLVQKYGGTSVGTPEKIKKVAARIARLREAGSAVAVVVSAMGHTTDELVALAREVSAGDHPREMDMLLSVGERVSMALLSMALRDLGHEAISFTGSQAGIITDESHTRARILEIRPTRVQEELARGRVVIVAGFQGVSRAKEITTLGRGGSDTTAVALAAALKADACEIYTDVPGIFSADPRLITGARRYEKLPLSLVHEMAKHGAQVMHAPSIESAIEHGLQLYVGEAHPAPGSRKEETGTVLLPDGQAAGLTLPDVVAVTGRLAVEGTQATVTLVGPRLEQKGDLPARVREVLVGVGTKPAGLTSQSRSITVSFEDSASGERQKAAMRALHERFVRGNE